MSITVNLKKWEEKNSFTSTTKPLILNNPDKVCDKCQKIIDDYDKDVYPGCMGDRLCTLEQYLSIHQRNCTDKKCLNAIDNYTIIQEKNKRFLVKYDIDYKHSNIPKELSDGILIIANLNHKLISCHRIKKNRIFPGRVFYSEELKINILHPIFGKLDIYDFF